MITDKTMPRKSTTPYVALFCFIMRLSASMEVSERVIVGMCQPFLARTFANL